jgi:TetR/AcrR family transcriptional regulator, transcriptional repressor for nem operon
MHRAGSAVKLSLSIATKICYIGANMSRTIEFDYERAIDRATQVFWKKGYTNASLRDLLKAMGIGEGSFYNALRSKKHLYLECLKHYDATVSRRRLAALMAPASAKDGVRAFFSTVLDELDDPKTPRVCLLAGSLSADVLAERDLNQYVVSGMTAFSDRFRERLKSAKESGELPKELNEDVAAQVLLTYLQGLFRVIRVLQSRTQVERQLEALLKGLGL